MKSRQKIILASGLLLFALLKVVGVWWWQQRQDTRNNIAPEVQAACQITAAGCPFLSTANLRLVGVGNAKTPFTIEAHHVPPTVQHISASFRMKNMDMGFNRFELRKIDATTWRLDSVYLPLCVAGRHDWQIEWRADEHTFSADFQTQP